MNKFNGLADASAKIKAQIIAAKMAVRKKIALKLLLKSIIYTFAICGLLMIFLLIAIIGLIGNNAPLAEIPQTAVLTVDFDRPIKEIKQDSLLTEVSEVSNNSFYEILTAIWVAAKDNRIKAIAAKVTRANLGLAQIEELRYAIKKFRESGKPAYIYSSGFGNLAGGTGAYYLASAFSDITMMPNTEIGLTGVSAEVPFLRNLLDKAGVKPEFYSRYEYKTAMASFTDSKVSKAFKNDMEKLLGNINSQVMSAIALERNIKENDTITAKMLKKLVADAPYNTEEALARKLIDKTAYQNEWIRAIKDKFKAKTVNLNDYAGYLKFNNRGKKIAVIIWDGNIVDELGLSPMGETQIAVPEALAQLEEIANDKDVKGVLLRINSPGGSYSASAELWNALNNLKKNKKIPMVVSMGDYAASGGYFVALAGDKIFADNLSITGSIGVLGGKFALQNLWQKLGVNWKQFIISENGGILSPNFEFSTKQQKLFNKSLDRIYADFVNKVATARNIENTQIDKLARGRVFVGREAHENRLIDEIGGFAAAMEKLRVMSGFAENEAVALEIYPKSKTLQQKLKELLTSAPIVKLSKNITKIGLDIESLNMLQQWQYDAVMLPIKFYK